jgi:hypothetical protein
MIPEKTIHIMGRDVMLRYCAATETNFETIAKGRSSNVFSATVEKRDKEGKPTKINPPEATSDDYIKLGIAAIIAAYDYREQKSPVTVKEILFETTPDEINVMVLAVMDLRLQWYNTPKTIPDNETDQKPNDDPKNAETPATSSN